MTDVLGFIGLLLIVPASWLCGWLMAKRALTDQGRRDTRSSRRYAATRIGVPGPWAARLTCPYDDTYESHPRKVWPPHHETEDQRDEMYAQAEFRQIRDEAK